MSLMMKSSFNNITAILHKPNRKIFPKLEYLLKFDGCSKGNPGPSACGAVLYQNDIEIWTGSKFLGYNETNNYAEYMGLIIGLNKAAELNIKELAVEGDSLIVIKQMNGQYKVRSSNISELHKLAMKLKSKFNIISFNHVYRENNKRADELCNIKIEEIQEAAIDRL
jgi:ribonuclease HI